MKSQNKINLILLLQLCEIYNKFIIKFAVEIKFTNMNRKPNYTVRH